MAKMCNAIDKIVVVDNCSTDYSLSKLTCLKSDKIDVIQTDKNGGYAYGNNFGCRYAEKNYNPKLFFISNPDVRFENPVLQEMDKLSNNHKDIGVVAPIVNQGYNIWNLPKFWGLIESIFLIWFILISLLVNISLRSLLEKVQQLLQKEICPDTVSVI